MVDAGKITLRVEVDAKEFERFMQSSPKNMNNFQDSITSCSKPYENLWLLHFWGNGYPRNATNRKRPRKLVKSCYWGVQFI